MCSPCTCTCRHAHAHAHAPVRRPPARVRGRHAARGERGHHGHSSSYWLRGNACACRARRGSAAQAHAAHSKATTRGMRPQRPTSADLGSTRRLANGGHARRPHARSWPCAPAVGAARRTRARARPGTIVLTMHMYMPARACTCTCTEAPSGTMVLTTSPSQSADVPQPSADRREWRRPPRGPRQALGPSAMDEPPRRRPRAWGHTCAGANQGQSSAGANQGQSRGQPRAIKRRGQSRAIKGPIKGNRGPIKGSGRGQRPTGDQGVAGLHDGTARGSVGIRVAKRWRVARALSCSTSAPRAA